MSLPFAIPFPPLTPEIFVFEIGTLTFALRWYALAYIVGLLVGWRLVVMLVKRPGLWPGDRAPMTPLQVEGLLTWVILGVVIGGRLGYVLFYRPEFYLENPLEALMIWRGGMSFHGGFLGVVAAGVIYCWRIRAPMLQMADALSVAAPCGLMLGRIANFINAELWGRPTEMAWGVIFPGIEAQACAASRLDPCVRHPSQLYEAGLEGLVLGVALIWLAFGSGALKRSGLVLGVFLAGYGAARFVVEYFRQPDALFVTPENPLGLVWSVQGFGLTMGQVLTLPMLGLGLLLVLVALLRRPPPSEPAPE